MKKIIIFLLIATLSLSVFANNPEAIIKTNLGEFTILLFQDKTPLTVKNFIKLVEKKFYNGIIFHRVIKDFMSQTGDPTGTGTGGPGYTFQDEFHKDLKHSKAGMVSMANRGPNTNGSQFFITAAPTPHLDNRHSVFGEVVKGMDICEKINSVKTGSNDKPVDEIQILSIEIQRDFTDEQKKLSEIVLTQTLPLIEENLKLFNKTNTSILLNDIKSKDNLYLIIWNINFSDNTNARFWLKFTKENDQSFNFLEYHLNQK